MDLPSGDQSLEYLSDVSEASRFSNLSSSVPSAFFTYSENTWVRLEANSRRAPSGLHTGAASIAGSNVRRFNPSRWMSIVQTSEFSLPSSVLSNATNLSLGGKEML